MKLSFSGRFAKAFFMSLEKAHSLLTPYVPSLALPYCVELWYYYQFQFRLSKKRSSKLGDYRFDPKTKQHLISVNSDLNPYNFLITYIHEVAHCANMNEHGKKAIAHGKEWKTIFRKLLSPLLNEDVFPADVLKVLSHHMKNPKASSQADQRLVLVLRKYDKLQSGKMLFELALGDFFKLNNRVFKKVKSRRSRIVCEEVKTGRNFLITAVAPVEVVS